MAYEYYKLEGPLMIEGTEDGQLKIFRLDQKTEITDTPPSKRIRLLVTDLFLQVGADWEGGRVTIQSGELGQEIEAGDPILAPFDCVMHPSGEPPCTTLIGVIDLSK